MTINGNHPIPVDRSSATTPIGESQSFEIKEIGTNPPGKKNVSDELEKSKGDSGALHALKVTGRILGGVGALMGLGILSVTLFPIAYFLSYTIGAPISISTPHGRKDGMDLGDAMAHILALAFDGACDLITGAKQDTTSALKIEEQKLSGVGGSSSFHIHEKDDDEERKKAKKKSTPPT